MESLATSTEGRPTVARCLRTLASSTDSEDIIKALQTLHSFLDEGPQSKTTSAEQTEFRRAHYTRTLQFLVSHMQADWLHSLPAAQRTELWDGLFLKGPPEQALLVLMEAIGELRPTTNLDHLISITERFLQSSRLADLLWSYCLGAAPSDSLQLREALLGRISALPDITANRLHRNNKPLFLPQQYYPLLATEMLTALERTCLALRDGTDCSLMFVAQTLGKVCIQGHSDLVLAVMAPRLSVCTRSDMVWQRVCWKLLENVPQRCMESVLTGLVQAVSGPDALGRLIGNLVLTNKKAQFVITHKLLLLQYKYETQVLRTVVGYLAADRDRRPLLIQVLRSVSQTWANPSAVKHTPLEQQIYVSKALLLSVSLLKDSELKELRSDLLQCMLGGMQSHLDSSVVRIRRVGMVVGECLSSRMDINGTKLKFQYDQDEETCELLSLMTPVTCNEPEPVNRVDSPSETNETVPSTQNVSRESKSAPHLSNTGQDSDLDSDDELTPYDMSGDQKFSQASPPRYLRDCLETLISSTDAVRVELSLRAAESLVRRNAFAAREISVQMTKVLLHMEDKYSITDFLILRQATMVALTVTDCIPVIKYLTSEFYSLNYSLRQRLDILEILAIAAQELSRPITDKKDPSISAASITELTPYPGDNPVHWRQVVEKRIQSKTKRLSKGAAQPVAKATPNRYAPVAGHFFFPLLRNYDKPQVTFDLLGSDHLLLGRLIHTLGLFMHQAVNAPIAAQMGCALLDFVWAVRYHTDQMVRRGVLFAVCSVFLSMPSQNLLVDLSDQLFETRAWLTDVAEGDPDDDCRNLAVQSLVLLDKSLKKQLQNPQALSHDHSISSEQ
ncbi:telomere length regulation protein TEL2 homolog [Embiotoca jacksoni]|uniref:telomere length regulation protein TEL2 homolog n=1 Tax=Embiotoca jacksoni TaxID=100190 RepID=UPI003703C9D5